MQQPTRRELDESTIADLRADVLGELILPDDPTYDDARQLWNGLIDRRPAVIVRPIDSGDVALAVRFAVDNNVPMAVRGGGHNSSGSALVDDGLVIDLSDMDEVRIDAAARTAWVQAGARVRDVIAAAEPHGLAALTGMAAHNGVSGSTLGGGIGWLRRTYGLGIDGLRRVELVTADGEIVTASEDEHADLFWAIRGGGGNFGVVTGFEFDLYPIAPEIMMVQVGYPGDIEREVFEAYRSFTETAPDEVTSMIVRSTIPPLPTVPEEAHGAPVVVIFAVHSGSVEEGMDALAPLREFAEPVMDLSAPMPLSALNEIAVEMFPDGRNYYWRSLFVDEMSDELVEMVLEHVANAPSPESSGEIWHLGGAMGRVPADATAFASRDAEYLVGISACWDDDADDPNVEWARAFFDDVQSLTEYGPYAGFVGFGEEGEALARAAYGDNYERLVEVKNRYDPENRFQRNLNVRPSA